MYHVARRTKPKAMQRRRRILGLPIGPKQDYERPWTLYKGGKSIGHYKTEAEAIAALPPEVVIASD